MSGTLTDSIIELVLQAGMVLVPVGIILWLVHSLFAYAKTPDAYYGLRKRYLIMSIISGLLLVGLTVSAIIFRHGLMQNFLSL